MNKYIIGGALASALMIAPLAMADSSLINFESYSLGTINAQDGWSSLGAAGAGCAPYDHAVAVTTVAGFGAQALRMSNAVTSGCFGDQTFSKSLSQAAGETTAEGGTMSAAPSQSHFEAEWDFASVTGAPQPGLSVVASPDRGDGARMGWIQMADTATGLEVNFYDYQDALPFGGAVGDPNGCGVEDDFVFTNLASGLDRTIPHKIKVTMDFVDGPRNDIVRVYVDGVLKHSGTSWEDYFRYCEGNQTRTVDSVLFRTGGAAAPATSGFGFFIDNLKTLSGASAPTDKSACKDNGWMSFSNPVFKNQGECVAYTNHI